MAYPDENFLLHSPTARRLFHEVARDQPIIDYHCHLSPREIATNHRWNNLAEIWLGGDHYKWRLLRANGIDRPVLVIDLDRLDRNIDRVVASAAVQPARRYRIVVKSLPAPSGRSNGSDTKASLCIPIPITHRRMSSWRMRRIVSDRGRFPKAIF